MDDRQNSQQHRWVDLILKSASQSETENGNGYLRAGQTCPNCGFATLSEDDLGNLTCPVCGFGVVRPCT